MKWLSYIAFIFSLLCLSYVLTNYADFVPEKMTVEHFSTSSKYTRAIQGNFFDLVDQIKSRKFDFADTQYVEVKDDHYTAKITATPEPNQKYVNYSIKMYYQIPLVMTRPVIVEAGMNDTRPEDVQAKFSDFFWEIR